MTDPTVKYRLATQEFTVLNELVTHCGQVLTPDLIDKITRALVNEMQHGPTAWAFNVPPTTTR